MRVAVVGAGIAGLTAAHELARQGHEVLVLEGSDRIGGKLLVGDVGGVQVDLGAESVLARRPEAVGLIDAIGLHDRVQHPATTAAGVWTRGAVRALPPTVLGVPADLEALAASGIVDGVDVRPTPVPDADLSVGEYVTARAGREVVDRLVEPLLGGVYAGHADDISLRAAAPQLLALGDDPVGSAVAARAAADPGPPSPVFAGLVGGVGTLPAALLAASGAEIRTGCTVRLLERDGDGWRLLAGAVGAVEEITADAVVVAAPAPASARLLAEVAPDAAFALAGIDYASVALVTVVIDDHVELPGSGFLVPPVDGRFVKAATFSSNKWSWVGDSGRTVLRASVGRAGESTALQVPDGELVARVLADLAEAVGPLPTPADTHVQRWGGALPQYVVGHLDTADTARRSVAEVRGLEVCGAAYGGVGIAAVVAGAQDAVSRLLAGLGD
ncbi:protoporphyrinogen oxidase [Aeromicrobium sp. Leaf350]|uniref:protoporphyrinogen oxidase n=1 Tax=Aeromicrobium sp. Leaf350 TaxID=2876565 RepID=UPI001E312D9E|nr:protoporphyrinogen oxidase [Aeromicrobium sp. Leaf350]